MAKKKKAAKPAPKKAVKPAPKKAVKAAKPVAKKAAKPAPKKVVKPAPKKAAKPIAKKVAKPAPKKAAKPVAKKTAKPSPKKAVKPTKPLVKKAAPAPKKAAKPLAKKAVSAPKKVEKVVKPAKVAASKPISKVEKKKEEKSMKKKGKEETKKVKPVDDELEAEALDLDAGLLVEGLDVEPDVEVEEDDDFEPDEPKRKGRKPKAKESKKKYDSEDFVRKQVVKIDLNKSLLKKQPVVQPKPYINDSDKRSRYSDKELVEFKELINKKLEEAQTDFDLLKQTLSHADDHGTDDTSPSFKLLEDGSDVLSKEETAQLASRQEKYIVSLKNALVRIENKSYGICRATGKLIPKERLRSVPHATLSIDAKLSQSN